MHALTLLGDARLEDDSGTATGAAAHRHSLALLALLAAARPGGVSRGQLVGFLWPETSESTARNRLNTLVHRLRQALGPETIQSTGKELRLETAEVSCDLLDFRRALEVGDFETAIACYGGPFMDGFYLEGSVGFDQWLDVRREELRQKYREALEELARREEERGRWDAAVRCWRRLTRDSPFNSRFTARLMEAMVEEGNPAGALSVARRHTDLLEKEFGTEPADDVTRLMRSIQERSEPARTDGEPDVEEARSLAVLPFEALGDGDEVRLLADGLHHDLLTHLSRDPDLRVISRASVLRYGDGRTPIPEVGRTLRVGTVLEGAVRQHRGRIRLTVRLVDVARDAPKWGETYDRNLGTDAIFDLQTEIARSVAGSLRRALDLQDPPHHDRRWTPTANLEAYRLCAQARSRMEERTEGGLRAAEELYRRALDEDAAYARAWVGLADSLALLHEYGYAGEKVLDAAEAAAHRAMELDPGSGEAYTSLGLVHEARHEGPQAVRAYRRAVQIQPGYADPYNWLSWSNQNLGRLREAHRWSRKAVSLNPLAPEVVGNLSITMLMTGDVEGALREARRARTLQPDESTAAFYEALSLQRLGKLDEAARLLEGLEVPWSGEGPRAVLALVRAQSGREDEARQGLGTLEEMEAWGHVGLVLAGLGDLDRAYQAFARVHRWPFWPTIPLHGLFPDLLRSFRADVRFGDLMGRVHRFWGLNPDGSFPRD